VKVKPLRDYICIQPKASEGVSGGGIIIPDDAREKPRQAEVLAVGPEATVKPGDVVLFNRYHNGQAVAATHVIDHRNKDGDGPLLIRETEILAVVVEA
jgi:chaperonin GroES